MNVQSEKLDADGSSVSFGANKFGVLGFGQQRLADGDILATSGGQAV